MQCVCSVSGPCPRHCEMSSSPIPVPREGKGAARGGGTPQDKAHLYREEPSAPQPGPSTALPVSGAAVVGPHLRPPGAPSPPWGRQEPPHSRIAGKLRAGKDGEGAESPVLLRRAGTPPNLSRSLPDPGASAVRAPGPQQLENSLRETIKVDYPVGSWSGNYLVN